MKLLKKPITVVLSLTVVACAVGAAIEFNAIKTANDRAQSIADTTALTAAVYFNDNNRPPLSKDEGLAQGEYTAAELGFGFQYSANDVKVYVKYDDKKNVTVTVSGGIKPLFAHFFGKDELSFSSTSVVLLE